MKIMITLSLLLNIAVLITVTYGIATSAAWVESAYGPAQPARGIVLAMYLAILIASAALLLRPVPAAVAMLLLLQIGYKLATPFTVGTLGNPVVISNLAIAVVHCLTLWLIVTRA